MKRPVTLPITEARCRPEVAERKRRHLCARYLVAADVGRPLADYTAGHTITVWGYGCTHFIAAALLPVAGPAGPTVHEAVKGLSCRH